MEQTAYLSIDYGTKFTGVATFCSQRDPYPIPYGRIPYKSDADLINQLLIIINDELIDKVIVGVPYLTDGSASTTTEKVRKFMKALSTKCPTSVEVIEQDETLSTFEAKERMKKDPRYNFKVDLRQIDALSATIILEDYLRRSSN